MDFLDPKKQRAHTIRLRIGYVFVALALLIATDILLYQAKGYWISSSGQVIQNGLVFVSSQPHPADIYLNGAFKGAQTNTRLTLPAGQYTLVLRQTGYRTWQRGISVDGGIVEHFDYPLLVPTNLVTTTTKKYDAHPGVVSQSPDQRWLVVQLPGNEGKFDLFDLANIKDAPKSLALPDGVVTGSTNATGAADASADSWQVVGWAADNRHALLKRGYQKNGQPMSEYIMLDRQDPTQSANLTNALALPQTAQLSLHNQAYDQYYEYDTAAYTLKTATLKNTAPVAYLEHVLAYKTYGSDVVLYVTDGSTTNNGQVAFRLRQGDATYTLRTVAAGGQYVLNLAQYSGDWYVAIGAAAENKVYVYKNPASILANPQNVLVPAAILKLTAPNYLAFSSNAQFIMAENGTSFAVYDAENQKSYAYQTKAPIDAPQSHAAWMDGDRLVYVSGGKLVMFDYDSTNSQTLSAADPAYVPIFDQAYKFLYTIAPQAGAGGGSALTSTSLLAG